jgi:hypothetical protein
MRRGESTDRLSSSAGKTFADSEFEESHPKFFRKIACEKISRRGNFAPRFGRACAESPVTFDSSSRIEPPLA